ncbi:hypothetical protein B0I37DRAFT_441023 [Chaetomium sp. MPI-CAGE-AT-0009]|nr:hypothetical protein B0I37DRAFT_441023 [Chaetomium sp. MPI-CAGE-AT-0009]
MLLRNASSQDRDPDIFHTMTSHNPAAAGPHEAHNDTPTENGTTADYYGNGTTTTTNYNNDLDDIWATPSYLPPHPHAQHNPHHHHHQYHYPPQEPTVSDIPRLSAAHSNAGYRDGITLAKARTAQGGFDEGYGLGATIGARAGQLLGVLEGLAAAVGLHSLAQLRLQQQQGQGFDGGQGQVLNGEVEARRIERLLTEARKELSVTGVFDGEYWAQDGNWRYEVAVARGQQQVYYQDGCGGGGGQGEGDGVVFADVAEAHPLLRKWGGIVRAEAARYGVDWEVLKDEVGDVRREGDEDERERDGRMRRERGGQPAARGREALAW